MSTRREQTRTATVTEIKAAALAQIASEGAPALSLRGVARTIGMSPAGLYRYYDGRDALLTDLLVDAYLDLARAVADAAGLPYDPPEGAPTSALGTRPEHGPDRQPDPDPASGPGSGGADPVDAMLRAIEAYRTWAVTQPARFLLIFGTPVPGYAAPEDGPTVEANLRMGQVFFTLAALAWRQDMIAAPPDAGAPDLLSTAEHDVHSQLQRVAPGFPASLIPRMLAGWALWHGLVTLEVTGQLDWIYPDTARFFTERMTDWLTGFTGRPVTIDRS